MEIILIVSFLVILFMWLITQIFYAKLSSIYTASGLAIGLALITTALATHSIYVLKVEERTAFLLLVTEVFLPLFMLLLILVVHQRKYKYQIHKTLVATLVGIAVVIPMWFLIVLIVACTHGDCI
jgi:hypothetical protein